MSFDLYTTCSTAGLIISRSPAPSTISSLFLTGNTKNIPSYIDNGFPVLVPVRNSFAEVNRIEYVFQEIHHEFDQFEPHFCKALFTWRETLRPEALKEIFHLFMLCFRSKLINRLVRETYPTTNNRANEKSPLLLR